MLARLAKLAARSAELRQAALDKEAGLGDLAWRAAKGVASRTGKWAWENPMTALGVGLTTAVAPGAIKGSYATHKAGFDPMRQQMLLGQAPVPPQVPT